MKIPLHLYHHVDRIYQFYFSSSTPIHLFLPQTIVEEIIHDFKEKDMYAFWLDKAVYYILNELYVTLFPEFVACIRDWMEDYESFSLSINSTDKLISQNTQNEQNEQNTSNTVYKMDTIERIQKFKELKTRQIESLIMYEPKPKTKESMSIRSNESFQSAESYRIYTKSLYSRLSFEEESSIPSIRLNRQDTIDKADVILSHYSMNQHDTQDSNCIKVQKESQDEFEKALNIVWAGYGIPSISQRVQKQKKEPCKQKRQLLSKVTTTLYFDCGFNTLQSL